MTQALTSPRIDQDVPCAGCGYNLRGLGLDATCPECGRPVEVPPTAQWLREAPAAWRQQLHRGTRMLHLGVLAALPLVYPGLLIAMWGIWQLTGPPAGRDEPAPVRHTRRAARVLLGLAMVSLVVLAVAIATADQGLWGDWTLYDGLIIAAHALLVLGLLATWDHLRQLAHRAPDPALAHRAARLQRCWILAVGLVVATALVATGLDLLGFDRTLPGMVQHLLVGAVFVGFACLLAWLWLETRRFTSALRRRFADLAQLE